MKQQYTLQLTKDAPNQQFFTNFNGYKIGVRLHTFRGIIYASIYINDEMTRSGVKCLNGINILGNSISQMVGCELKFETTQRRTPDSSLFNGADCVLYMNEIG